MTGRRTLISLAGPVAGVAVALWLVAPVFGSRPPAGEDVMAHLVRADFGLAELVARGRLDGWFPRFVLGHQEFLFNGPGLVWLMGLLRGMTLGALSTTGALKVTGIAAFVAMVPATWFLARSFGLPPRAAGIAAVLGTCVSGPYGPGLDGLYKVGLVPHQVAAVFFCLALGACLRLLRSPSDGHPGRWVVLAAVSLAAVVVTHLISALVLAVVLGLCLVILVLFRSLSWAGLGRLAAAGLGAAALAGFWLVPLAAHRDLRGVVTTWGTPPLGERLAGVVAGDVLLPAGLGVVVAAGWGYLLARRGLAPNPGRAEAGLAVALCVAPLAYLLLAHGSLHWPGPGEVTLQLSNRGLGYVGILGVLAAAALLGAATERLGAAGHVAVLGAAVALAVTSAPGRDAARQFDEPVPQMRQAAATLARVVPDGARFATQRDFPGEIGRTGVIHPETWLARVSGRNSLNGFNLESSSTPAAGFAPDRLDESRPRSSARRLARLGVTHVVTTADGLFEELSGSARFTPVWRATPLAILKVVPERGRPDPASLLSSTAPVSARLTNARPEHLAITVEVADPTAATVALAWSPKWHGRLDGRPVQLGRTADGLVEVDLPAGQSRLRLDFRSDGWDRLGAGITLLTLLGATAAVVNRCRGASPARRRRRLPSGSAAGASPGCSARGS